MLILPIYVLPYQTQIKSYTVGSFDMADMAFGGSEEENAELKRLYAEVVSNDIPFCLD